ncbi:MAG: PspC domain-containing protein [Mucilaginibacter polytrichastri]|nr:PspC domain-containing protein [Mucilaginibacter polytrichastri]
MQTERKLYRNEFDKTIAGVCSGLAEYMNIDVTLVRLAFVLLAVFKGGGVVIYIVLWIVLPAKRFRDDYVDYIVDEHGPARPVSPPPPRKNPDTGATIGGMILIAIGGYFLLDDFDIIPDWFNIWQFWPLVLIGIGAVLIFGTKSKPKNGGWENTGWDKRQPGPSGPAPDDNQQSANPPTV